MRMKIKNLKPDSVQYDNGYRVHYGFMDSLKTGKVSLVFAIAFSFSNSKRETDSLRNKRIYVDKECH